MDDWNVSTDSSGFSGCVVSEPGIVMVVRSFGALAGGI